MDKKFLEVAYYSNTYGFQFQFWGDFNAVFISKQGVDLKDYGGNVSIEDVLTFCIDYVKRINPNLRKQYLKSIR